MKKLGSIFYYDTAQQGNSGCIQVNMMVKSGLLRWAGHVGRLGECKRCEQNVGVETTWKTKEMEEDVKIAFGKYVVRMGDDWNWLGTASSGLAFAVFIT
jgi:hypothetical protein